MLRLSSCLICLLLAFPASANPIQNLDKVGSAKLRVFLWNIYESALYTPSGNFEGIKPGLALEIEYRRDISKRAFIDYTREEWQKQSLYKDQSELWLANLRDIFPSVKKGDSLVLELTMLWRVNSISTTNLLVKLPTPALPKSFSLFGYLNKAVTLIYAAS